jgi:hypothetical protein
MKQKFDSKFEKEAYALMVGCEYHPSQTLEYVLPKTYEPDFVYKTKSKTKTLSSKEELVFLFQKPKTPMPGSRRRKNGTRYTMEEWAAKQGFRWYTLDTLPAGWTR